MKIPHFTLHKKIVSQEDWHKLVFCLCFRFKQQKQHIISNLSATLLHPHQHCHQQAFNQRTALHNSDYEEGRALRGRGSRPTVVEGKEGWYGVHTRNYYCIKVGCNQL